MDKKYSLRADTWINNTNVRHGKIIRVFKSGFDARFDDDNIFFSLNEENLHPCSVLLSLDSLDNIYEELKISFGSTLSINNRSWLCGPSIPATEKIANVLDSAIANNLTRLANNLKLFGKKSIIRTFMAGNGSAIENNFIKMQHDLCSKKLNLENFVGIVGVGEGLTPSVDDFFSGMLLADRFSGNGYINASEHFFCIASNKTTRQSALQMKFAEQGLLSLRFERFLKSFVTIPVKSVDIVKLLNYGHTSGTDILSGVLFYFSACSTSCSL